MPDKEFTIEYWYWYSGANEKDSDKETIIAESYDQAVSILKTKYKRIFKTTDKTKWKNN